ncbi:Flagellar protein [Nitrospina watsonii]|uniref:Flagellar protein n=1 Tax=Nitrospina watsonii TaxID=1323948 RepID=A0ABN8VVZ1_9BACT|nr:Flagellar protein [Nitrospina watsonii]
MRLHRYCWVWALALNLLCAGIAGALPLTEYNKLRDVAVRHTQDGLHIQLQFRQPPTNYEAPVFFKNSVQIDLPFAYLAPAKQYFPIGDDEVRQVYASQFSKELLRIRLILADRNPGLAGRLEVKRDGNNLEVHVWKAGSVQEKSHLVPPPKNNEEDPLSEFLASAPSHSTQIKTPGQSSGVSKSNSNPENEDPFLDLLTEAKPEPQAVASESIPKKETLSDMVGTAFRKDGKVKNKQGAGPSTSKHQDNDSLASKETAEGPDILSAGVKMAYTLALVLGVMFLLFHLFKKFVWKNGVFGSENKPIKVLSTGFLGPKKSIALVDVAGEILVLGIANENISLLANVEDPDQIDLIRGKKSVKKTSSVSPSPENELDPISEEEAMVTPSVPKTMHETATATAEKPVVTVPPQKRVDSYESVVKKNKTTNPFPDFVKQFAETEDDAGRTDAGSVKDIEYRLKKTLRKNRGV